ncbi:hypothetical protein [Streptomyces shenzhenensis]|nr:hypothetical protein [Streptomyces shenzhenensis]
MGIAVTVGLLPMGTSPTAVAAPATTTAPSAAVQASSEGGLTAATEAEAFAQAERLGKKVEILS